MGVIHARTVPIVDAQANQALTTHAQRLILHALAQAEDPWPAVFDGVTLLLHWTLVEQPILLGDQCVEQGRTRAGAGLSSIFGPSPIQVALGVCPSWTLQTVPRRKDPRTKAMCARFQGPLIHGICRVL